jgi:hypothetical protein
MTPSEIEAFPACSAVPQPTAPPAACARPVILYANSARDLKEFVNNCWKNAYSDVSHSFEVCRVFPIQGVGAGAIVDYLETYYLTPTNEKMVGLESIQIKKQRVLAMTKTKRF